MYCKSVFELPIPRGVHPHGVVAKMTLIKLRQLLIVAIVTVAIINYALQMPGHAMVRLLAWCGTWGSSRNFLTFDGVTLFFFFVNISKRHIFFFVQGHLPVKHIRSSP